VIILLSSFNFVSDRIIALVTSASIIIGMRELIGLLHTVRVAVAQLIDKVNVPTIEVGQISYPEIFVLNLWLFRRWSLSQQFLANELLSKGSVPSVLKTRTELRHVDALRSLTTSVQLTRPQTDLERNRIVKSQVQMADVELSSASQMRFQKQSKSSSSRTSNPLRSSKYLKDSDDEDCP
jgi:hypothetical protein